MMMSTMWFRGGICAAVGFLLIVWVIAIVEDSQFKSESSSFSKKVEIKGSSIVGYHQGKLSWRIKTAYIWAGRSPYLFRADRIESGTLYNSDGDVVIDEIEAERVRVNTKSKTLSAFDNISGLFIQRVTNEKKVRINADELRYFSNNKRTYLYKNVRITRDDMVIYPRHGIEIDNDKNMAYAEKGVVIESDEFMVSANKIVFYIDDDYSEMSGDVRLERIAEQEDTDKNELNALDLREQQLRQKKTSLICDYMMHLYKDDNDVIKIRGNIYITQEGKRITGDHGYYNKKAGDYTLRGRVTIKATSLEWVLNKSSESFKNEDIKASIEMPVEVSATQLQFDSSDKRLELTGGVKLTLKDKVITCEKLVFNDADHWVTLIGNVTLVKQTGERIVCSLLKLNIDDETVMATQGVVTEFIVK